MKRLACWLAVPLLFVVVVAVVAAGVKVPRNAKAGDVIRCSCCDGLGGVKLYKCKTCDGSGEVTEYPIRESPPEPGEPDSMVSTCSDCDGRGLTYKPCKWEGKK